LLLASLVAARFSALLALARCACSAAAAAAALSAAAVDEGLAGAVSTLRCAEFFEGASFKSRVFLTILGASGNVAWDEVGEMGGVDGETDGIEAAAG
jgi:hypothetical protein